MITGGAHLHPDVGQAVSERLGCLARQGYGATEATCTISAPLGRPSTPATAHSTCGQSARGAECR